MRPVRSPQGSVHSNPLHTWGIPCGAHRKPRDILQHAPWCMVLGLLLLCRLVVAVSANGITNREHSHRHFSLEPREGDIIAPHVPFLECAVARLCCDS